MAVELDSRAFKALSSPTRVELLKKLRQKPRSLTSLAEESRMSVQATDEHLHKLVQAGLVEKDKKSKWAYYRLSAAGNSLVQPDRQPVYLMLAVSLMLLLAAAITWNQGADMPEFKDSTKGLTPTLASGHAQSATKAALPNTGVPIGDKQTTAPMAATANSDAESGSAQIGAAPVAMNDSNQNGTTQTPTIAPTARPAQNRSPTRIIGATTEVPSPATRTESASIPWPIVFGIGGLASLVVATIWWQKQS